MLTPNGFEATYEKSKRIAALGFMSYMIDMRDIQFACGRRLCPNPAKSLRW
jgi:hypothetical protein